MSDVQLTLSAKRVLIALVLLVEEGPTNPVLHDRFGITIDKGLREALVAQGLIELGTGLNRAITHTLTDEGWRRGRSELAAATPDFKTNAGPAWGRLLYGALNALDRLMTEQKLQMADVFRVPSIEEQVLGTYRKLARDGDLVSLALLRAKLPGVPKADLDEALTALDRARTIQLEPDPNRAKTSAEAQAAAISIGGEKKHLMRTLRP